ncbi:hypothetical protein D3C85_90320 [compost metagenome]
MCNYFIVDLLNRRGTHRQRVFIKGAGQFAVRGFRIIDLDAFKELQFVFDLHCFVSFLNLGRLGILVQHFHVTNEDRSKTSLEPFTEALDTLRVFILDPKDFPDTFDVNALPVNRWGRRVELDVWTNQALQLKHFTSLVVIVVVETVLCYSVLQQVTVLGFLVRLPSFVTQIPNSRSSSDTQHNWSTQHTHSKRTNSPRTTSNTGYTTKRQTPHGTNSATQPTSDCTETATYTSQLTTTTCVTRQVGHTTQSFRSGHGTHCSDQSFRQIHKTFSHPHHSATDHGQQPHESTLLLRFVLVAFFLFGFLFGFTFLTVLLTASTQTCTRTVANTVTVKVSFNRLRGLVADSVSNLFEQKDLVFTNHFHHF